MPPSPQAQNSQRQTPLCPIFSLFKSPPLCVGLPSLCGELFFDNGRHAERRPLLNFPCSYPLVLATGSQIWSMLFYFLSTILGDLEQQVYTLIYAGISL